ncbi:MAG: M23 family metallopeptidase [Thermoanaerobaculia bacterium]|nr:M23 family metallopeptidase [Thermoanaerobaculia bacterium]
MRRSREMGAERKSGRRKRGRRVLLLVAVVGLIWLGVAALRPGPSPTVEISTDRPGIGPRTEVDVTVDEPRRGIARITVELVQGGFRELLVDNGYETLEPWAFWGEKTAAETLEAAVGRSLQPELTEGEAVLRVTAWPAPAYLRRGSPTVEELVLPVRLTPPLLEVLSSQHYVAQGGAEAVVYRVGASSVEDGVEVGEWFFPGHPLPGGEVQERFALFAVPYDVADASGVRLRARDDVGNEFARPFVDQFFSRPMRQTTIRLSEPFMQKVVAEILSQTPEMRDRGDLLANYLAINGELRRRNAETLIELAGRSQPTFAWRRVFLPMPNAQVMSAFADRRTYVLDGEAVDQQDHLGFDLASVRQAPIPAANTGRVVLARYFGIYGNAVVLDHGYGLLSLYAHLSAIRVAEGEAVERGQIVGTSGETGLAGGDHLHFSMLLYGLPVDPREWWDLHWLQDRLERKLGPALPLEE